MHSIPLLTKLNFDNMPNVITYRINIRTKSMIKVLTPCKKFCIIKSMNPIKQFIRNNIQIAK